MTGSDDTGPRSVVLPESDEPVEPSPLESPRKRIALIAVLGAVGIVLGVLAEHLLLRLPFGIPTAMQLAVAAALLAVAEVQRELKLEARGIRWMDRGVLGLLSFSIALAAGMHGALTSPLFLALSLVVFARTLFVHTPGRWSVGTALVAWAIYPVTLVGWAFVDSGVASGWSDANTLIRFAFANAVILGFAGLGVFLGGLHQQQRIGQIRSSQPIGQYELVRRLGEHDTGEIFLAKQPDLRRDCALKVMHRHLMRDEQALKRFRREMSLAAQLNHPNIVEVYGSDRLRDGRPLYTMELLEGLTLREVVEKTGPQPAARVIHLLSQVAEALEYVHERSVVHRNITPDTVFVSRHGSDLDFVKLIDFGLAGSMGAQSRITDISEVRSGDFVGDPTYTPPEVVLGNVPDARGDIYSLGAVGYFLLTGEPLFGDQSASKILHAQVAEDPRTIAAVASSFVPPDLELVITRCLSKLPEYRYRDMLKLRNALASCEVAGTWTRVEAKNWWSTVRPHEITEETPPPGTDPDRTTQPTPPPHRFVLN